jgi:ABC-type antimicrobial peptide transport system permease subunit
VIRTGGDPRELASLLRTAVREEAPQAPFEQVATLEDLVSRSVEQPRLYAVVLGTFAAFALAIAGVGLFGVLSYSVAQRTREIGVRTALGAQARDIVALVAGQSLRIACAGVAAGLLLSLWMSRALRAFLYGVTAHDAVTFAAVGVLLVAVALVAAAVPARRAARVDPVKVLRA